MADELSPAPGPPAAHEDVLSAALRWRDEGRPVALATVLRTWGSSPRQPGSQLVVSASREMVGSVSGGCVEGAVIEGAVEVMASGAPRTMDFGVSDEDAWSVGLACGGKVSIYVEAVDEPLAARLRDVLDDRAARRGAVLATRLGAGERRLLHPLEDDAEGGGGAGAGGGTGPVAEGPAGDPVAAAARDALLTDRSRVAETPEGDWFLQVHNPPLRLVIVGAVHIAQALAPMAALAGFDVTVVDPRRAFATGARFPGVHVASGWPDTVLPSLGLDHRTAVVTLSHDPKLDDPALEAALRSGVFYVGALGSRRTHAKRVARLADKGFGNDEIARIHAPVGLDIRARTPEEIAVSALAQVVERLRAEAPA